MSIDNNGPEAAYPGPTQGVSSTGEGHDSGLEKTASEPKQGTEERPEDWNPPPVNPGSDPDAQTDDKTGKSSDEEELGFRPRLT